MRPWAYVRQSQFLVDFPFTRHSTVCTAALPYACPFPYPRAPSLPYVPPAPPPAVLVQLPMLDGRRAVARHCAARALVAGGQGHNQLHGAAGWSGLERQDRVYAPACAGASMFLAAVTSASVWLATATMLTYKQAAYRLDMRMRFVPGRPPTTRAQLERTCPRPPHTSAVTHASLPCCLPSPNLELSSCSAHAPLPRPGCA